jgi:hypothetical protein
VDFTRTAESVAKTGADLTKWAKQQETKVYSVEIVFLLYHITFIEILFIYFYLLQLGGFGCFIYATTTIDVCYRSTSTHVGVER